MGDNEICICIFPFQGGIRQCLGDSHMSSPQDLNCPIRCCWLKHVGKGAHTIGEQKSDHLTALQGDVQEA